MTTTQPGLLDIERQLVAAFGLVAQLFDELRAQAAHHLAQGFFGFRVEDGGGVTERPCSWSRRPADRWTSAGADGSSIG